MRITLTVGEAMNRDLWGAVCALYGYNEWAVNEGLISTGDEVSLTEEQARDLGLIG